MIIGRTFSINTANAILQPFPKTWGDNVDEFQGWCDTGENARGRVTNNCLISWYHGTRFANLSKYTWLHSSLHQKGECFKDWQVMVGPSQTPLGGAATIESAVRSVLSPRLAHKTGLNRQKIITFLSHSVAPRQGNKTAHKTGRILLHRCHIFVAHKNSWTLTGKGLLPCCHISVAPQNSHFANATGWYPIKFHLFTCTPLLLPPILSNLLTRPPTLEAAHFLLSALHKISDFDQNKHAPILSNAFLSCPCFSSIGHWYFWIDFMLFWNPFAKEVLSSNIRVGRKFLLIAKPPRKDFCSFFFTKITHFLTIFFYFDCFVRKTETWKEGGWILKVFVLPFLFLGGRVSSFDEMCPPLSGAEKVTSRMEDLRDTCYPIFKENLDKLQRPFDCSCCAFDVRNFPAFLFA